MRKRWRVVLPVIGIILFSIVSYHSLRVDRETPSRYFWWSSIRLDSDPSNRRNWGAIPCQDGKENCWELRTKWVDPGLLEQFLMLSALPAFAVGGFAVRSLGRVGINQVSSFMFLMPVLICAWYYLIGWLLDRWISKRSHLSTATDALKPPPQLFPKRPYRASTIALFCVFGFFVAFAAWVSFRELVIPSLR
jgi:hypothetical protein